jgi:hypothetical protein
MEDDDEGNNSSLSSSPRRVREEELQLQTWPPNLQKAALFTEISASLRLQPPEHHEAEEENKATPYLTVKI